MTKATLRGITFNWGWFPGLDVQSIIKAGAWQHLGRHGVVGAESSMSCSEGNQDKTSFRGARMSILKPVATVIYIQHGPTYCIKAIPPNSALPQSTLFKPPQLNSLLIKLGEQLVALRIVCNWDFKDVVV